MRCRALLQLGLATALGGVPSLASAADASSSQPAGLDGVIIAIAAGAIAASVAGIALFMARRREPGPGLDRTAAERAIAAEEDTITAALQRRTLRRGRMLVDEDTREAAPPRRAG